MAMYCSNCGAKLEEGQRFCEVCGKKVDTPIPPATDAPDADNPAAEVEPPVNQLDPEQTETHGTPDTGQRARKSKKKVIAIVSCVAAVAIVALICLLVLPLGNTWEKHYELGEKYLSEENYEEAIIEFTAAIELDGSKPEAFEQRANVYILLAEMDKDERAEFTEMSKSELEQSAEADLLQAVELGTETVETYTWLGVYYQEQDDPDKRLEILETGYDRTQSETIKELLDEVQEQKDLDSMPFMTSTGDMEKIGDLYIYVRDNGDDSRSIIYKENKNDEETVLLTEYYEHGEDEFGNWVDEGGLIHEKIISNGKILFFGIDDRSDPSYSDIYKINISTGSKEKIKTVKLFEGLDAYYDGNLYYSTKKGDDIYDMEEYCTTQIWKYNIESESTEKIFTGVFYGEITSYGQYMSVSGWPDGAGYRQNFERYILNLKDESKSSLSCLDVMCTEDGIYYTSYSGDFMDEDSEYKLSLKKCNYNFEDSETIRTWIARPVGEVGEQCYIEQLGRTFYQYRDSEKDIEEIVYFDE